jgi:putative transposase
MPRRKLYQNYYYHIYQRSFSRKSVFLSDSDFDRFILKIQQLKSEKKFADIRFLSYCLLPNHFHFLIVHHNPGVMDESAESLLISQFLGDLQNAYAKYFNRKYEKKGPVFDGRFSAKLVPDECYLEQVQFYIENNAVKHGIVDKIEDWNYSSYSKITTPGLDLPSNFDPFFD